MGTLLWLIALTATARPPALRTNVGPCRLKAPISLEAAYEHAEGQTLSETTLDAFSGELREDLLLRCGKGAVIVRFPVEVGGRIGTALDELRGAARLGVDLRAARRLRIALHGSVRGALRPGWPDVYQPVLDGSLEPTGELAATGRYGYFDVEAGLGAELRLDRRLSLGLAASYDRHDSADDPNYDEVFSPDHLTPGDRQRVQGSVRLSGRRGDYRHASSLRVGWVDYGRVFARDAVTGATHATSGRVPANPLEENWIFGATTRHSLYSRAMRLRFVGSLGYDYIYDEFQGYRSRHELTASFGVRLRPARGLAVEVTPHIRYARYTDDGYGEGDGHPPLEGSAPVRQRLTVGGVAELSWNPLKRALSPFVRFTWDYSDTNYPDYAAWAHPQVAPYDIDFDWNRMAVLVGFRSEL